MAETCERREDAGCSEESSISTARYSPAKSLIVFKPIASKTLSALGPMPVEE